MGPDPNHNNCNPNRPMGRGFLFKTCTNPYSDPNPNPNPYRPTGEEFH